MPRTYGHLPTLLVGFVALMAWGCPIAQGTEPQLSVPELNSEGIRALNAGDLGRALGDFVSANHADPTNADVSFNLGLTYFRLGRYKEAVAPLQRSVSVSDPADKVLYLLGVSLYQAGDFAAATEQLEILHHRSSSHQDEILYLLEESYRRGKRPQDAKQRFAELETRYPNSCFLHKLMGSAYSEQGQDDQALAEFKDAVAVNPSISDAHREIGIIYLNRRQVVEASESFRQELALNPCDPASHYYLGEIARKAHQATTAAAEYKKAIACDASYAESHLGMGLILAAENLDLRALEEFREAARLQPDSTQAHYQLARCLQRTGNTREADVELQQVKRLEALENKRAAAKLR